MYMYIRACAVQQASVKLCCFLMPEDHTYRGSSVPNLGVLCASLKLWYCNVIHAEEWLQFPHVTLLFNADSSVYNVLHYALMSTVYPTIDMQQNTACSACFYCTNCVQLMWDHAPNLLKWKIIFANKQDKTGFFTPLLPQADESNPLKCV